MDIKLKNKSIRKQIMISIIGILIMTFLVSAVLYITLSKQIIVSQTKAELKKAANLLENEIILMVERDETTIRDRYKTAKILANITLLNRFLLMQSVVLDRDNQIVYPKTGWTTERLQKLIATRSEEEEYIVIQHTFTDERIPFKKIVLLKRYNDSKNIRSSLLNVLLISFLVGLVISGIIGYILSKRIYYPIKSLRYSMNKYLDGDQSEIDVYESKDEIQELSEVFRTLTNKITRLTNRQKQFFQDSSHELKTPLMSIQGYAEAIKDGIVGGKEQDESLDIIISEAQRLKSIVDDVIYLSKIDNLEDELIIKTENLKNIILEGSQVAMPLLKSNNIDISINCEGILINCDYEKMKRVFINLIGNGARYAKTKITVNVFENEESVIIDVIDDGNGFEFGFEEKVFDRFYNGKKGGSGIGLSLTKEIVEKHNGEIVAINNINYGAIFKITLKK